MKKFDLSNTVEQYMELVNQIAMLERQKEALANYIKQVMGETEELCVGPHVIRFKFITSNRFDTTAFKKAHADLYTDFLKESISRRFTVA